MRDVGVDGNLIYMAYAVWSNMFWSCYDVCLL